MSGTPHDSNNSSIRGRCAARATRESVTCLRGADGGRRHILGPGLRRYARLFGAARLAFDNFACQRQEWNHLHPSNGLTFSRKPRSKTLQFYVTVARGLAAATFC